MLGKENGSFTKVIWAINRTEKKERPPVEIPATAPKAEARKGRRVPAKISPRNGLKIPHFDYGRMGERASLFLLR